MPTTPSFKEDHISQIPALQLLMKLGYEYVSPDEAWKLRGGKNSNFLLEEVLEDQLEKINNIDFKGKGYKFSNNNVSNAIQALKDIPYDGLIRTNEQIYDLLCLGKSFEETIAAETKSFTLRYIDWDNFENNVFHVTAEYDVEKTGGQSSRRPDIVLFVNGIPLVVIECKRPDIKDPAGQAVSQNIRNQQSEECPRFFIYSQLLLALSPNKVKFGTTGTPAKFWSIWKERQDIEPKLSGLINIALDNEQKDRLFVDPFHYTRTYFEQLQAEQRQVTEQDKVLYSLCRPERLLELTYRYIVYDAGEKKIARYQQYSAVENTIERIKQIDRTTGKRTGGIIWHTQGSGKSITMVMLAKAIALEPSIENPRIAVVTDRINLDKQIYDVFHHCGKEPIRAKTGKHLIKLISGKKESIITTVIDKFESALNSQSVRDPANNIFVLVDESHRSQYGTTNAKMLKVFPNACYIGFTGTPLFKKDKNTAKTFGGFIDKYTIDQAVEDEAVVPLLYEGRHAVQDVDQKSIDSWFERLSEGLSEAQKADLKKKFSTADQLNQADQKIYRIAYDISDHFAKTWQSTGFKGQLATPSKKAALKYKKYLDEFGMVSSEVLISGPDTREGQEDIYEDSGDEVQAFWKKMMSKYGSEDRYNTQLISAFKDTDTPEIMIVVDKLLTGFDAPRNTVLYLTKSLKEHSLLQAIARVNRLCDGKDYGYIVDYYGVLGDLNQALTDYTALEQFDETDMEGTITNVAELVGSLKQKHSDLRDIFKGIKNKLDEEEYEQLLGDEELRDLFYKRLSEYGRTLKIALSTVKFIEETPLDAIEKYKKDLHFFVNLRVSIKRRYAEEIDYREYEPKIQKLIDTYIKSDDILKITPLVNIFDKNQFDAEVDRVVGSRAKAETIANRTKKTIIERMDEDPAFYAKFSKLLKQAIDDYKAKRLSDALFLQQVTEIMNSVRNRTGDDVPDKLNNRDVAKAFYGLTYEVLGRVEDNQEKAKDISADIGLEIDEIIQNNLVVDWAGNKDIQNRILDKIEEYLYQVKDRYGYELTYDDIDRVMEQSLVVAMVRYAQ